MKSTTKIISSMVFLLAVLTACNTSPSLQKYIVESKENNAFISIDLPASIIQLKDADVSDEIQETLKSIKKLNFLALQLTDETKSMYETEKTKVKNILKHDKYKQLMRMKMGPGNVMVSYLGEEDAVDEVIIFGAENTQGFAIVRILGENMEPAQILKLMQEIKLDDNAAEIQQLKGFIEGIK